MARILDWAAQKRLVPLLGGVFPWSRFEDAHRALAAGRVKGKLLLDFAAS
jgi:NADPH:quinone reductase-like Zn-dependent oxidoreductase